MPSAGNEAYYCLELDDCSAPSCCSFSKYYFGTMPEICAFVNAVSEMCGDTCRSLVSAFRDYEAGKLDVTHAVAYTDVPLLTPVKVIHKERAAFENYGWDHLNTWNFVYHMRCEKAETEHLWLECKGQSFRAVRATFKRLQYASELFGEWDTVSEDWLWGYPCIIRGDERQLGNALAVQEKRFPNLEELERDWEGFKVRPDPEFKEFCNDIFGNG